MGKTKSNKIADLLGGVNPNAQENNIGAVRGTPAKNTKASGKKVSAGFKLAEQSFSGVPAPSSRDSGNTFKAKPGAAPSKKK